jgi:flagellar biosynthesis protein FlhG
MKSGNTETKKTGSDELTSTENRLNADPKASSAMPDTKSDKIKPKNRMVAGSHRLTSDGIEYDDPATTKVPDMTKPVLGKSSAKTKTVRRPTASQAASQRSREMNNLLGSTTRLQLKRRHVVKSIAFISNKGGVGKTHISTNMSFYLSRSGKKTLMVDLDLGHADVTSKLGYYCENTVVDLLEGRHKVKDLIYTTPYGFDLIAGESGDFRLANLGAAQRGRFIRAFRETGSDYNYVIYDLAAGIGATTLDFALAQDHQVIVTTPQDIVAGYSCIKAAFHRFCELERKMAARDPDYHVRKTFRPFVVLNQVDNFDAGRELFERVREVTKQNIAQGEEFNVDLYFLGVVTSDPTHIRQAELSRYLYSQEHGASRTGQCMNFLVENMMRYRDPDPLTFTTKLHRFVNIFMKSVSEAKYAK